MSKVSVINRHVQIGQTKWKIKSLPKEERLFVMGTCSLPVTATIKLDPTLKGMSALEVYLHECIHALDGMYDIKLTEQKVEKLGYSLAMLLAHNPWILDYANQQINEEYGI